MDGRPADKRAAIVEAALALFAERGFHGTRVPEIAARADVAAGTIYRYFDTKEALVNAVFRERKQALTDAADQCFDPALGFKAQAEAAWRGLVAIATADPTAFRFLELHDHAAYLDAGSLTVAQNSAAGALAFLADAAAHGTVRTDLPPPALLGLFWGALVGFVQAAQAGSFELTPAMTEAAGQAAWRLVAAS